MINVLFIPYLACYDKSKGAGCKVENFYIKELAKNPNFNFRILTFEDFDDEYDDVINHMEKYQIAGDVICRDRSLSAKIIRAIKNIPSRYSPFDKYGNFTSTYYLANIKNYIAKYKAQGFVPDCVILGWTQIILFINDIKKMLPNSVFISIEEDVSFLGIQRKMENENAWLKRVLYKKQYEKLKRAELKALSISDYSYVNNPKDYKLLLDSGIQSSKLDWLVPWYEKYNEKVTRNIDWDNPFILYYGAMGRPENYLSVQWLIDNIMPLLNTNIRLFVIGSGSESVKKYESEKIKILGFVEDVSPYFSKTLCLVAPLVLGAGVKIKVLEAMSAGVPVLTNAIGIEGIAAENGVDFFYCEEPKDYARIINLMYDKKIDVDNMSENSRKMIEEKYNYSKSGSIISKKIIELTSVVEL